MSEDLLKRIKDENIGYVDLRFSDVRGKMHHVTFDASMVDEDLFEDGTMFDGSSIDGWKSINESDMVLLPDASTADIDPFYQQDTLTVFCDVLEPDTAEPYNRDPRGTARQAETYIKSAGIGDTVYIKSDDDTIPREPNKCEVVNVQTLHTFECTVVTYGVNVLDIDCYHEYNESELED